MTMAGINVREVTDVDRRTARRLGMTPERVNEVMQTWAGEYLAVERDSRRVHEMANAHLTEAAPVKAAPAKRAPRKAAQKATETPAKSPRKAAAKRTNGKAQTAPKFDHAPDDGHDYIPVSNRDDADCMECGAKEAAHVEMSTADAEKLAGDGQ